MSDRPKSYFIQTYGCQMNELDSELMMGILERRGLIQTSSEKEADILIFNTCSIRDLAERKVMGKIGLLKKSKRKGQIIGVAGCMASSKKGALFEKLPHIDFVVGTNNIADLDDVLDHVTDTREQACHSDDLFQENIDYLIAKRKDRVKAFVSIIRGCDKRCTYCIVPYTRGREVSRPPDTIVEECKKLAAEGYKEITLLGQNVNSYGKDHKEWGVLFHDLLYKIDKIEGLERVRFMTSHPVDISIHLMEAVRDLKTVCEFVHFPLQAGSNRVLKKMHRIYTKEDYLEKVEMFRRLVPDVALGTDLIVGFPTETDAEFQETCDLFEHIGFSTSFLFAYSERKGAPAARWRDDIPDEVKQERLQALLSLNDRIVSKNLHRFLGTDVEALVESVTKDNRMVKGRTRCWKKVLFSGDASLVGTLQRVHIEQTHHQTLLGISCF